MQSFYHHQIAKANKINFGSIWIDDCDPKGYELSSAHIHNGNMPIYTRDFNECKTRTSQHHLKIFVSMVVLYQDICMY